MLHLLLLLFPLRAFENSHVNSGVLQNHGPPTTDPSICPTPIQRPPTHQQVLNQPTNHWLTDRSSTDPPTTGYQLTSRSSTGPPTTDPLTSAPATHRPQTTDSPTGPPPTQQPLTHWPTNIKLLSCILNYF